MDMAREIDATEIVWLSVLLGPGYWRDHIACGGPDPVSNMQWQTIREAKAKDKWERPGGVEGRRYS